MSSREFVPAKATIEDLERKAFECEQQADGVKNVAEARTLREEAKKLRAWASALKNRLWTA